MPFIDLTTLLTVALLLFVGLPSPSRQFRWVSRLLVLLLLSPGLRYVSALFMFPIRLQLSAWAGGLLRLVGVPVQVEGNVLVKTSGANSSVEMAVDPACMGLQMTGVSLLVALFALIWHERQLRRSVPFRWVLIYGLSAFGLTIFCNLLRIVLLVAFEAMPGSALHEGMGLVCVAVYTWLPMWLLAQWLVQRTRRLETTSVSRVTLGGLGWGAGLLAAGIGLMAFAAQSHKPAAGSSDPEPYRALIGSTYTSGLHSHRMPNGFTKLSRSGLLIYLKPQTDWFSAEHNPMVCWRGSGYTLRRVRETWYDGHPAYAGELHKKGKTLYTSWWFSNGSTKTISQLTIRGRMLRGETGFALINITTDKPH